MKELKRGTKLRVLSGHEVCDILKSHGFVWRRTRGSHMILHRSGNGRSVTVPVPDVREMRIGTLRAIIRQSGVPRSEFETKSK